MSKNILVVDNLNMHYETLEGNVMAVNNVTFSVKEGESFGLVGESGCGKSSVASTLLQLQSDNAVISSGSIKLDNQELVGYFCVVATKSLHYKDHIFATCDIIYVKQDKRAGMTGYKLIEFAEQDLKKLGVSLLAINTKIHAPFDKLLNRMDYNLTERLYTKYIGE